MFDINSILDALLGFVGGGGVAGVLMWRLNKRAKKAEVVQAEQSNMATNNDLIMVNQKIMSEQNEIINDLRAENVFCKSIICKHGACPFREPERGRGKYWLDSHEGEGEGALIDVVPIQLIAQKYGFRVSYNRNSFREFRQEIVSCREDDSDFESDEADPDTKPGECEVVTAEDSTEQNNEF